LAGGKAAMSLSYMSLSYISLSYISPSCVAAGQHVPSLHVQTD
jgi:hypothetical protein